MIDPKDKCVHKNKHEHIHIYIQNMFVTVELLWDSGEEGKERQ
jgi:hypothetical protein